VILEALIEFAEREKLGDPDFEAAPVHWILRITMEGRLAEEPVPPVQDPKLRGQKKMLRPFTSPNEMNHGGGAHFLTDTLERALLMRDPKLMGLQENRRKSHSHFKQLLNIASSSCPTMEKHLLAVLKFLDDEVELERVRSALLQLNAKPTNNVTFEVAGQMLVENAEIRDFWRARRRAIRQKPGASQRVCLATGALAEPVLTTEKIRGIPGTLPLGANLISCDKPSFCSYGLKQGENAPLSGAAEVKIRAALNHLVERGTRIGKTVFIHWTRESNSVDYLGWISNPDEHDVRRLIRGVFTGETSEGLKPDRYYLLSISGNGARIVIRDWIAGALPKVETANRKWFDDNSIIAGDGTDIHSSVRLDQLLISLARESVDELPAHLPSQIINAAVRGEAIPRLALKFAVERHKTDTLNPVRAGFIRACILRSTSAMNAGSNDPILVGLNANSRDKGYLCGRVFAVLDRLQYLAMGRLNASLVERFYVGASTTPALIMGRLFRNAHFYLRKTKGGIAENVKKEFEEILGLLGDEFPPHLDLEGQGRFALGFYHQKAEYRRRRVERSDQEGTRGVESFEQPQT